MLPSPMNPTFMAFPFSLVWKQLNRSAESRLALSPPASPAEQIEHFAELAVNAGKDGSIALGIVARLSAAKLHHQVKEMLGLVALKGHHEFLVVKPERIRRVEPHRGILVPDFNVLIHHALARGLREPIPGARLHE